MSQSEQPSLSEESVSPLKAGQNSRLVGAELIRQLSCQKFHQSDETLHQLVAAKRKTTAPIIKRFSDNHHDRHQRPVTVVKDVSERARLTRQLTCTNSESSTGAVPNSNANNRRHQLAEVKDHRNWRSCDVNQTERAALVPGTHRPIVGSSPAKSIGKMSPSSLDLATSFHSLSASAGRPTTGTKATSHFVSISPSAHSAMTTTVNHHNELESQEQRERDARLALTPPFSPQQHHREPVRYYSGQRAGLGDGPGQEEDRVVLPPLAGNRVISTKTADQKNSKLLSQRMAKVAGSRTKKVLAKQPDNESSAIKTNRRRPAKKVAAPGAVALAAIAVAVVTGNDTSSGINDGPNPRRRARGIVILTSVFLLFTCLFLVGITLRLAPLIDELVRKENELQTFTPVSSNGDIHSNATTAVLSPIGDHRDLGINSTTATPIANTSTGSIMMNPT